MHGLNLLNIRNPQVLNNAFKIIEENLIKITHTYK
jgi:hypothetical protein